MMKCQKTILKFLKDENGQSTVEYIVMLAIVIAVAMKFKGVLTNIITNATGSLSDNITSAISTSSGSGGGG